MGPSPEEASSLELPEAARVPAPVHRRRARFVQVYALLAALGFAALGLMARSLGYFALDVAVTRAVQSFEAGWFDRLMRIVSFPGYNPQAWIIVSGTIVLLFGLRLRWEAIMTALAGTVAGLLGGLAKLLIARPRPPVDLVQVLRELPGYGFPSGHVVFYTGFFGFLWFLAYTLLPRGPLRTVLLVLLGALLALVGLSRVYLGVHWASDALGGYLLGSLVLLALIGLYRRGIR